MCIDAGMTAMQQAISICITNKSIAQKTQQWHNNVTSNTKTDYSLCAALDFKHWFYIFCNFAAANEKQRGSKDHRNTPTKTL